MGLLRTSFYTTISQSFSVMSGLISIKVVSSKIGPEGMAMMGQYLNTTAILSLLATGAIGTGVIKYLAQYGGDRNVQMMAMGTAIRITLTCTLFIGLFAAFFSFRLSNYAFKTNYYYSVFVLWGIFLIFSSLSSLMGSMLNGLKKIPYLTIINVSGSVIGVLTTVYMAYNYGVYGVLIASNFTSFLLFIIHLFFLNKYKWFSFKEVVSLFDKRIAKQFAGFALMVIVSGVLAPSIQFLIRDRIIEKISFEEAGYWQSVIRISDYYLGFVIAVLGVYYLPRLSEIESKKELRKEIWNMYKTVLPVIALASISIWVCRFWIIRIILTPKFLPAAPLFGVQFLGDFFKIASWLLGYVLLAKAMKFWYILSEIIFATGYVLLSFVLIENFGIIGASYAFLINYFVLWILMLFFLKWYFKTQRL